VYEEEEIELKLKAVKSSPTPDSNLSGDKYASRLNVEVIGDRRNRHLPNGKPCPNTIPYSSTAKHKRHNSRSATPSLPQSTKHKQSRIQNETATATATATPVCQTKKRRHSLLHPTPLSKPRF